MCPKYGQLAVLSQNNTTFAASNRNQAVGSVLANHLKNKVMITDSNSPRQGFSVIFLWLAILFNVCLVSSNLFAVKVFQLWDWCILPGAVVIFPISYIINDCLSEVYGYRKARLVIWTGFAMNFFLILASWLVIALPGAPFWDGGESFNYVFGSAPRAVFASLAAFLVGSTLNAFVMSRMKVADRGLRFGRRAVASSLLGEAADSAIFIPIVFWSSGFRVILTMMACQVTAKVLYEIIILPLTSVFVKRLKQIEHIDAFDSGISYNPFKIKDID